MKCLRFAVLFIVLAGCRSSQKMNHVERNGFLMDTVIRISLYDVRPEPDLKKLADQVFVHMLSIEKEVSSHIEDSEIQQINHAAGSDEMIRISKDTESILTAANGISEATGGAFDLTVGPLKKLWGFDDGEYHIPDHEAVNAYLALGNYKNIDLQPGQARIYVSGLNIDPGGIAKGYIIDAAVTWLRAKGVRSGLVEGGGDLRVFGPHPQKPAWKIGIQDPRNERGELIGVVSINDQSIATSGDYERFFIENGKRYHHILDPGTGYPSERSVSVTVIANSAMLADAYATAVFVMGPDSGLAWINRLPDAEAFIVYQEAGSLVSRKSAGADAIEVF